MDHRRYPQSHPATSSGFGPLQPQLTDFARDSYPLFGEYTGSPAFRLPHPEYLPGMLPVEYTAPLYSPPGILTVQGNFYLPQTGLRPLVNDGPFPTGIPLDRSQRDYLLYPTMHPIHSGSIQSNGTIGAQVQSQIFQPPTSQHTYPTYTTTRTTQSAPISEHNTVEGQVQAQSRRPTVTRNLVPQKPYQSNTRQGGFTSSEVVQFIVNGRAGIRLSDALEEKWEGLDGRDDRSPFAGNRSQVIIRLQLEGCSPWNSKVHTRDFTTRRREIARMKLAKEIAKSVHKFIAREKLSHPNCRWGDLSLKNVFLTRVVRVSVASWQPELFVEHSSSSVSSRAASSSPSSNRVAWESRSRVLS